MRHSIKYRFIILLIVVNVFFGWMIFLDKEKDLAVYQQMQEEKRKDDILQVSLIQMTLSLLSHHERIFAGEFIDPQSYLAMVRELSDDIKTTKLLSVKSYIKENNDFILTATSASTESFEGKRYASYRELSQVKIALLAKVYDSHHFKMIREGNTVAMNFVMNTQRFIVFAKIKEIKEEKEVLDFKEYLKALGVFTLVSILLLLILLHFVIRRITRVEKTIKSLFVYLLDKGDKEDIIYIKKPSKDELGRLSKRINEGIEAIVLQTEENRYNAQKDTAIINEMITVVEPTQYGIFGQRLQEQASNPQLTILKNHLNAQVTAMNILLTSIDDTLKSYLSDDYTKSIEIGDYEDKARDVIISINTLGENSSDDLRIRMVFFTLISSTAKHIEAYIESNAYMLEDVLLSLKKILVKVEADYKFAFIFDNSLQVIKKENTYVNKILDTFSKKYIESITLITALNNGEFEDEVDIFIARFHGIVQDSSVRDDDVQKILIDKVKAITSNNLQDTPSKEKINELLALLVDEIIKDIRYSLFLIEDKVYKLASDSSSRLSSFSSIKELSYTINDKIIKELKASGKIEENIRELSKQSDDSKYTIIDDYKFLGKDSNFDKEFER
jgi:hypothetical protein